MRSRHRLRTENYGTTNGTSRTVTDIKGNTYTGKVYTSIVYGPSTYNFEDHECGMSGKAWESDLTSIKKVAVAEGQAVKPVDMSWWFYGCANLEEIDLTNFDLSNCKSMNQTFKLCSSLKRIDLTPINATSKLTGGFGSSSGSNLFNGCTALEYVNMSGLDLSGTTGLYNLFNGCSALKEVDMSNLNVSKVTNISNMFKDCTSLEKVDLSGANFQSLGSMASMFSGCKTLKEADLSDVNAPSVTTTKSMFEDCRALESVDLSSLDTTNVTDMSRMFTYCNALKELDLSSFNTSNVNAMNVMFNGCTALEALDLSNFRTSKVTNMELMFGSCKALKTLDISSFDTSKVTGMGSMFSGCKALQSLDVSSFDTSKVVSFGWMFQECSSLEKLDLSNFDTSGAYGVDYLAVSAAYANMFYGCTNLKELDISNFTVAVPVSKRSMFGGDNKLERVALGEGFTFASTYTSSETVELPKPPNNAMYTGKWVREEGGQAYTPSELRQAYNSSLAGVWIWQVNDKAFTVNLDTQGGTVSNTTLYGDDTTKVYLPLPSRPGDYVFKGWNTEPDGSGTMYRNNYGQILPFAAKSTTTLYAIWEYDHDVTYTVKHLVEPLKGGDAYTTRDTEQFTTRDTVATPVVKNYEGLIAPEEQTVELATDSSTVVEYKYTRKRYTIAFEANGGSGSMDDMAAAGGSAQQLPACAFTKDGSMFTGWNTAADGSGTTYVDKASVKNLADNGETITLYAQWATVDTIDATEGVFKIKLKGGQTATFVGLPAGTTYEVVEATPTSGWQQTGAEGDSGSISSGALSTAAFENTYNATGRATLFAHKELIGSTPAVGQFDFTLTGDALDAPMTAVNSAVDENEQIESGGTLVDNAFVGTAPVRFPDLEYTLSQVLADAAAGKAVDNGDGSWTYAYAISEVAGDDEKISYDGAAEGKAVTATVKLTDNGAGKLTSEVSYAGGEAGRTASVDNNLFVNRMAPGKLTISKTVVGATGDVSEVDFNFDVTLLDNTGAPLRDQTYTVTNAAAQQSVTTNSSGVATVKVRDGEAATIEGLPAGATYTIVEDASANPGFTNTAKSGESGTIEANGASSASFENTYEAVGSIQLRAVKSVRGGDIADYLGQFEFELRDGDTGELLQTKVNGYDLDDDHVLANDDEYGAVVFDEIAFGLTDVGTSRRYTITEKAGSAEGMKYDDHESVVIIDVTDNGNGTLKVTASYDGKAEPVTFYNDLVHPIAMPGTGRGGLPWLWIALVAVLAGAGTVAWRKLHENGRRKVEEPPAYQGKHAKR